MAAHESQSLLIELQVCRSDAYLSWLGPQLHGEFGGDTALYSTENLGRLLRHVERGFIRVESNEVTYPAHVILRFRLERAMMAGDLAVAELPGALERRGCGSSWASRLRMTGAAACRISTGTTAPSATSQAIRWARWRLPS